MFWFELSLWTIVPGALAPLILVGLMLFFRRRNARISTQRRVVRQFNGRIIRVLDARSYFYGWKRHWDMQWRGHGVLLLTPERLYFRLWQRNLDLSIPTDRIRQVLVDRAGDGRPRRHRLLQVSYRGADDQLRIATWLVREPELWLRQLQGDCEESDDARKAQEKHIP